MFRPTWYANTPGPGPLCVDESNQIQLTFDVAVHEHPDNVFTVSTSHPPSTGMARLDGETDTGQPSRFRTSARNSATWLALTTPPTAMFSPNVNAGCPMAVAT